MLGRTQRWRILAWCNTPIESRDSNTRGLELRVQSSPNRQSRRNWGVTNRDQWQVIFRNPNLDDIVFCPQEICVNAKNNTRRPLRTRVHVRSPPMTARRNLRLCYEVDVRTLPEVEEGWCPQAENPTRFEHVDCVPGASRSPQFLHR